jgi:hypothetical protein
MAAPADAARRMSSLRGRPSIRCAPSRQGEHHQLTDRGAAHAARQERAAANVEIPAVADGAGGMAAELESVRSGECDLSAQAKTPIKRSFAGDRRAFYIRGRGGKATLSWANGRGRPHGAVEVKTGSSTIDSSYQLRPLTFPTGADDPTGGLTSQTRRGFTAQEEFGLSQEV